MFDAEAEGWTQTTLGDLCDIAIGGTPSRAEPRYWSREGEGSPWASIADLRSAYIERTKEFISQEGVENSNVKLVPRGTVLMSFKLTIGRTAIAGCDLYTNEAIAAFRPRAMLDNDFLFYWLPYLVSGAETDRAVKGATLNKQKLLSLTGSLPPLEEQRRIAEVLRSVERYIHLTSQTLAAAQTAKNATLIDALGEDWPETTVGELLAGTRHPMRSGPFGSALLKSELVAEGVPFLGIDNVQVERFVPTYKRFISQEKYRELVRYTVFPGDVMVTIMGTVGRCCVVPSDVGTAISSKHVWTLTLDAARYSPDLLAWQINHAPWVLEQLIGSAQGGIMSAISSGTLRGLVVPLPPPAKLRAIEELLLSCNSTISLLQAELESAEATKSAVTNDLLSGRIRVPS
jgi:type I restriction enzyme S subunit